MQDTAELWNDDELHKHAGSDVGFGQAEVEDRNSVAHDSYLLDFLFSNRKLQRKTEDRMEETDFPRK